MGSGWDGIGLEHRFAMLIKQKPTTDFHLVFLLASFTLTPSSFTESLAEVAHNGDVATTERSSFIFSL